jgi:hypothetical protein
MLLLARRGLFNNAPVVMAPVQINLRAGCRVPHPFAFFANGWETTNHRQQENPPPNPPFSTIKTGGCL